jgi:hypothetical protein
MSLRRAGLPLLSAPAKTRSEGEGDEFEAGNGVVETFAAVNSAVKVEYFLYCPHIALASEIELFPVLEAGPLGSAQDRLGDEDIGIGGLVLTPHCRETG